MDSPRTATSERSAALVRRGRCWECVYGPDDQYAVEPVMVDLWRDADAYGTPEWDAAEEWLCCPQCDKRWRIVSPTLIIERLPLAAFAAAIEKQTLRVGDHVHTEAIILQDGTRLTVREGDTWPVPPTARWAEWQWNTA